jgi:hypothetical protein
LDPGASTQANAIVRLVICLACVLLIGTSLSSKVAWPRLRSPNFPYAAGANLLLVLPNRFCHSGPRWVGPENDAVGDRAQAPGSDALRHAARVPPAVCRDSITIKNSAGNSERLAAAPITLAKGLHTGDGR